VPENEKKWIGCVAILAALALAVSAVVMFLLYRGVGRASAEDRERGVWFVHATDPHLFLPAAQDTEKAKKDTGEKQEGLNEKALSDALRRIGSLPEGGGPPAFLVLTGDLGVEPCSIAKSALPVAATTPAPAKPPATPPQASRSSTPAAGQNDCVADDAKRAKQIERLVNVLGASPVHAIYLVAGNNDVAHESPGDAELGYFNKLIGEVQTGLAKKNIELHNLTSCYVSGTDPQGCRADISGTTYRLIGFPSYSFKNDDTNSESSATEGRQFQVFQDLLEEARQKGKKVLVLSHIPEIDDPYLLAQARYTANPPPKALEENPNRSPSLAWNVSKKILDGWAQALQSDTVAAVLAGHLHDSHQEIYQPPYAWSSASQYRVAMQKLFLAPPLAVKNQDTSPIQARGFALLQLGPDGVESSRQYWYNSETSDFTAQQGAGRGRKGARRWHWPRAFRWVWSLDSGDDSLVRLAVLLIALLTAFLTVVAIWQIPPPQSPLAAKNGDTQKNGDAQKPDAAAAAGSPFSTKFGQTVIAGLGGLVATDITKAFGTNKSSGDANWYYIAWFILFFFALLLLLNIFRALVEAMRARVVLVYWPEGPRPGAWTAFGALWNWLVSWRMPFLTLCDTFINLIQGKNQTETYALSDTIVEQQRNLVQVAHSIRKDLNDLIERRVQVAIPNQNPAPGSRVRVSISVMSDDQSSVYYVSQAPGSLTASFDKNSVAWVSVFTGEIRWYLSAYNDQREYIVLFDNTGGTVAGDKRRWLLSEYFQARQKEDYDAFVMFPFPWPRRGYGGKHVKGAIHISFQEDADLGKIFVAPVALPLDGTDTTAKDDQHRRRFYDAPEKELNQFCPDAEVRATLYTSIRVLAELMRRFNEEIFKTNIQKPEQSS
jgi:hypothetical protein